MPPVTSSPFRVRRFERRHLLGCVHVEDETWGKWQWSEFANHIRTPAHRILVAEDARGGVWAFVAFVEGVGEVRVVNMAGLDTRAQRALQTELYGLAGARSVRWDCLGGVK